METRNDYEDVDDLIILLFNATRYGDEDFVKKLIGRGANVNVYNKHGRNAFLANAARYNRRNIISLLRDAGAQDGEEEAPTHEVSYLKFGVEFAKSMRPFFENLPADKYAEDGTRCRAYSLHVFTPERGLIRLAERPFFQNRRFDSERGAVLRDFAPTSVDFTKLPAVFTLAKKLGEATCPGEPFELGIHQIRISASGNRPSLAAPEGRHRDLATQILMFNVHRCNVRGGKSLLFEDEEGDPFLSVLLDGGDALIVRDENYYHDVTPISMHDPELDSGCYRDMLILTATTCS